MDNLANVVSRQGKYEQAEEIQSPLQFLGFDMNKTIQSGLR
jgi:hypothetical protein